MVPGDAALTKAQRRAIITLLELVLLAPVWQVQVPELASPVSMEPLLLGLPSSTKWSSDLCLDGRRIPTTQNRQPTVQR
ncbi:hypothetical protein [Rhizobium sp. 2YAF20]|uniref:hypothetical protein n=1 Tax=Rhizobium sp. 2YAF20 TaxID=3233027 RepID=UPI003F973EBC